MFSFNLFSDLETFLALIATASVIWILRSLAHVRNPRGLPLPPGPKGLPLLGNIFQIPKGKTWKEYAELSKEHGDLVYLNAMGRPMLILGSLRRAIDLLEKRAANYSDKPATPLLELMNLSWAFSAMSYGPAWRHHRRTFHQHLNQNAIPKYYPIMHEERVKFLRSLRTRPEAFLEHMTMRVHSTPPSSDIVLDAFTEARIPGRYLVNSFPALRHIPAWFPGAGFQSYFKGIAERSSRFVNLPFESAKVSVRNGLRSEHPSLAAALIERLPQEEDPAREESEKVARNVCAITYAGGADTTVTSATAAIYVLASHPEVQQKAQAELDSVIGFERLPVIEDRDSLPYIHAIVKEVSHWYTVAPLASPHVSAEDDVYDGFFIPKGTFIMANSWAIMHDPELFERPFEFNPERFLKDGQIDPSVLNANCAAFGFGRRICAGRSYSNAALFLFVASLLAIFEITPPKDEAGNALSLVPESTTNAIAKLLPFKCKFITRSGREGAFQ